MTDKKMSHLVGYTVCLLTVAAVGASLWQSVVQHKKVDPDLHDLVVLLAGALIMAFRTGGHGGEPGDPVSVTTDPGDTVVTQDVTANPTPPTVDIHPDAPATSDL